MLKRIKQVVAAVTATITLEDRSFANSYLNTDEQALLWAMNLPDQRHVLNVAYTVLQLAKLHQQADTSLLVKCALLHDVGKIKGDVSTVDKIITVMGHTLLPQWSKQWGRPGRGSKLTNIRHAFYIYFHHAHRSAVMLTAIGADPQLVEIVARHHQTPTDHDPLELILLRRSDDMH
jgi:putative nucleotidyltransferase with HDIG domain